jgi:hypothetical protein
MAGAAPKCFSVEPAAIEGRPAARSPQELSMIHDRHRTPPGCGLGVVIAALACRAHLAQMPLAQTP